MPCDRNVDRVAMARRATDGPLHRLSTSAEIQLGRQSSGAATMSIRVLASLGTVACALVLSGCHYTEEEKRAVAACSTSGPVRRRPRASKSSSIGIAVPTSTVTEAAGGVRTVMATYFSSRRMTRSGSRSQVPCRKPQAWGSRLLRDARNDMWSARDDIDARCDPGQVRDRVASPGRVQTLVCSPSPVLRAHSRAVPETIGRRLARQRRRIGQRP